MQICRRACLLPKRRRKFALLLFIVIKFAADDADQYLPSMRQAQSQIEYLICTRINAEETSEYFSSPLIGFRVAELPCFLIAVSTNGEPTLLPLTSTTLLRKNDSSTLLAANDNDQKQVRVTFLSECTRKVICDNAVTRRPLPQVEDFRTHIQNILKPETGSSRPVFKLDSKAALSPDTYAEVGCSFEFSQIKLKERRGISKEGYLIIYGMVLSV